MSLILEWEFMVAPTLLTRTPSTPHPSMIQPSHPALFQGVSHQCTAHCLVNHSLNTATHIMNTLAGKDPSLIQVRYLSTFLFENNFPPSNIFFISRCQLVRVRIMIVWFGYDRIITINKRLVFWKKIDIVCKEIIPQMNFYTKMFYFLNILYCFKY